MTVPAPNASLYTDFKGISDLRRDAQAQDPKALREAARQFESLFTRMMLKSMRDASFGDPTLGSDQQNFYRDMFDDQLAVEMSKGKGLGLADMLVQQLTRAGLAPPTTAAAVDPKAAPLKPQSLLNPYASPSSTTPEAALGLVGGIDPTGADASALDEASVRALISRAAARLSAPAANGAASASAATDAAGVSNTASPASVPDAARFDGTPETFVRELWPVAQAAGRELGVDPRHVLAQAALETGWGRSVPSHATGASSNNFFGIKPGSRWDGETVSVRTLEFENGLPVARRDAFRAYDSAEDCFRDYVSLLKDNPRYAAALNTGDDAHAFARGLQSGGYATDPAYARKVAAIAQNLPPVTVSLKSTDPQPIAAGRGAL